MLCESKGKQTEINANERHEARTTNHKTHNMTNHFLLTSRNLLVRVLETDEKHFFPVDLLGRQMQSDKPVIKCLL